MRNVLSKFLPLVTAALLGVAAFAQPVNATNYTVANGTELLNRASTASPGDTITLTGGVTYPVTIAPATGNTVQPIVFIGNTTTPITVTDVNPTSHTRYYGIAFTNAVDLGTNKRRVMFDHCTMAGMSFKDADSSSVRACTIGGTDFSVNAGNGYMAQSDTLESCTFTSLSATGWYPILFGITDAGIGYVDSFVRRFNTFNIAQSGSAAYTPAKHFKTSNMLSYANKFTITSTATGVSGGEGDFGMVFRDSSYNLTMRRDTLLFNNSGASFNTYGLLTSSGMGGAYATSLTGFTIDSCYIRVHNGTPVYLQAQTQGLRFRYNVLRTRNGTALSLGSAFSASSNDPYMHHNTLMGAQAVHFSDQANTGGRFSNNILWGTSTATCAEGTAVGGCSNAIPVSLSDSNFVYSTTADSTRSFYYTGGCLAPRAGAWAARPNDTHSYWGNPQFADTSWAALDVTPGAQNFSLTSNFTLGYAGAIYASPVVQEAAPPQHGYPRIGLYAGAGSAPRSPWWPLVESGRDGLRQSNIDAAARFDVISLNPSFADSAGSYGSYVALSAIKALRAANPNILVLGEPLVTAAYERTDADTANKYNYYFQAWRAADQIDKGNSVYATTTGAWTARAYTDSTSSPGFLWSNRVGYKGWFYQTAGTGMSAGTQGVPGYSNWNINLAYQPTTGNFPLADSIASVVDRHFIRRQHPDGTWVYDGIQFDLATSEAGFVSGSSSPQISDAINWSRAGYASKAAFDTAWTTAHNYLMAAVRTKAIAAGRQYFLVGGNGSNGVAYGSLNGWMRESWPNQQGGTWLTNLAYNAGTSSRSISLGRGGGADTDANRFQYDPQLDWLFQFACTPYDSCSGFSPYSAANQKLVRYGLGTACLTGATYAWGPSFASLAKGGGYENWWYDEYAVDTVTAQAGPTENPSWLGEPLGTWYNNAPTINATDWLGGKGTFEAGNGWTFATGGGGASASFTYNDSAAYSGSKGLRARITAGGDAAWRVAATISDTFAVSAGDTVTLTFRARASFPRIIEPRIGYGAGAGTDVTGWSTQSLGRYIGTEWKQYRFSAAVTAANASCYLSFWMGDTSGVVDFDDITVHRSVGGGRARGGSYIREFAHGIVIVNPTGVQDTVLASRKYRRIVTQGAVASSVNTGEQIAVDAPIVVPTSDAVFLVNSRYATPSSSSRRRGWLSIWLHVLGKH